MDNRTHHFTLQRLINKSRLKGPSLLTPYSKLRRDYHGASEWCPNYWC
jgi:hypothetical protein